MPLNPLEPERMENGLCHGNHRLYILFSRKTPGRLWRRGHVFHRRPGSGTEASIPASARSGFPQVRKCPHRVERSSGHPPGRHPACKVRCLPRRADPSTNSGREIRGAPVRGRISRRPPSNSRGSCIRLGPVYRGGQEGRRPNQAPGTTQKGGHPHSRLLSHPPSSSARIRPPRVQTGRFSIERRLCPKGTEPAHAPLSFLGGPADHRRGNPWVAFRHHFF